MGPYSHYALAAKLESILQPENANEYYWGAVAPDIRYPANLPRDRTHLSQDRIKELASCYPHLKSFLTGYHVHILIDQIDVSKVLAASFPLKIFKRALRRISPQQMVMLVEMVSLQNGASGEPMSGAHNEVLAELGVTPEQTRIYYQSLQSYFDKRSFEVAISAFQEIGMIEKSRLERYINAYRSWQKRRWMKTLLSLSIKTSKLEQKVVAHVSRSCEPRICAARLTG
ncbi:MAG: hypothetical protein GX491_22685 [Chloroflexi bacterium]|nr:hypothetical protein [Chloroflexota bacterium]